MKQNELEGLIKRLRNEGKTIAATNGCFDILHTGHTRYLKQAAGFADVLIVLVNSDKSVKKLKGETRPINSENDRAEVLEALKSVDYTVIFDENSPIELLLKIKPDVYAKGGDYTLETLPEAPELLKAGIRIEFVPFVSGKSTTSVIEKMKQP